MNQRQPAATSPQNAEGALTPVALRARIRTGRRAGHTSGASLGYVQANLVIVPATLAGSFRDFCLANPQPLPLLEVTEPGVPDALRIAPGADLRTDVPRYCVYRQGRLTEQPADITALWQDDFVAFLLGCSFTAEDHLLAAGVQLSHLAAGRNVAMWATNRACIPVGPWHGPMVVSMRPIATDQLDITLKVTGRLPLAHGAPVHVGDPASIGVTDLAAPDWGDAMIVSAHETPVFWACGVTPQAVIAASAPELAITHAPGRMFVTDVASNDVIDRHPVLADQLSELATRS